MRSRKIEKAMEKTKPAIFSTDGTPVEVNTLLYAVANNLKWGRKVSIQVYRVTEVSLKNRFIRLRCAKGIEQTRNSFGPPNPIFSTKAAALKHARELIHGEITAYQEKIREIKGEIQKLRGVNITVSLEPAVEK
jgi:hypothetical protein